VKVVLMHDWLTGFRGGERILEAFCEMYPDAPIYTLIHKKGSTSKTIESKEIITSFLDRIPGIYKYYRFFLPIMPLAASLLKIRHDADLVISSSHCVIKGVKKPKGSKHICYIHTPMRYIYDQFDNYFKNTHPLIKMGGYITRPFLRWWDKKSNSNVDHFLPNSQFVQKRIQKYYEVGSTVVYPFVDFLDFSSVHKNPPKKEDFYVMVSAFAPNKKVDLAIKAFNLSGRPLKIIGSGSKDEILKLKSIANMNIEFLGRVSREEIVENLSKAKALIFPGVEDFGITPLESLSAGTPVIAYRKGGVLESLDNQSAIFFDEPNENDLAEVIRTFEKRAIYFNPTNLYSKAELFSKKHFFNDFQRQVNNLLVNTGG
tara:strand:+ start:1839 stop:2954 length:1116 start_codon:yes stop_codon:yes gene_type:complete